MTDIKTAQEMAKILSESFGDKAAFEAERREREAREAGQDLEAEEWYEVRKTLDAQSGPPES